MSQVICDVIPFRKHDQYNQFFLKSANLQGVLLDGFHKVCFLRNETNSAVWCIFKTHFSFSKVDANFSIFVAAEIGIRQKKRERNPLENKQNHM